MGGEIKTPPMGRLARLRAGYLMRMVQDGESLTMPTSRTMPEIGPQCHELRISDDENDVEWRVIYFVDDVAIVILDVFEKKTQTTPERVKRTCRERRLRYLNTKEGT
jgi:phage-related protein